MGEKSDTNQKFDRRIIEGPLTPAVIRLAAPTILANMFGGVQGLVDHILVGNVVGANGNAAIGVSSQIFIVVVVFVASIFTGMGILVSRYAGAANEEKVNRTVYQAFITAFFVSFVIIAPLGYFGSPYLLDFVNAVPEVQAEALPYLRTMFLFSYGMMLFFMLSGALRSAGDAKTPMTLGIAMTVLNVAFSAILILQFGTIGAAIGTCLASSLVAIYSIWKLWNRSWVVSIRDLKSYAPNLKVIKELFKFGLPAGFQGIAMNIGGVILLSFVGALAYSAQAQAAYAIAYGQLFSFITWISMGMMGAAAALVGQNLGANQPERAAKAVHTCARFAFVIALVFGVGYFFLPNQFLSIFGLTDPIAVSMGVDLLRVLSVSGLMVSIALTYTGGLQGSGDTKSPLYISIISQVIVPLGICFGFSETIGLQPIHIWFAILAGHTIRCILSVLRFNQGKWKHIKIDTSVDVSLSPISSE